MGFMGFLWVKGSILGYLLSEKSTHSGTITLSGCPPYTQSMARIHTHALGDPWITKHVWFYCTATIPLC